LHDFVLLIFFARFLCALLIDKSNREAFAECAPDERNAIHASPCEHPQNTKSVWPWANADGTMFDAIETCEETGEKKQTAKLRGE
jgi:hypothetical protein